MQAKLLGRWESANGKHWVELYMDGNGPYYRCHGGGGSMAKMSDAKALAEMERRVTSGYFLPDTAKSAMIKVK